MTRRAVDDGRALCLQLVEKFDPSVFMPPKDILDRCKPEKFPGELNVLTYFNGHALVAMQM